MTIGRSGCWFIWKLGGSRKHYEFIRYGHISDHDTSSELHLIGARTKVWHLLHQFQEAVEIVALSWLSACFMRFRALCMWRFRDHHVDQDDHRNLARYPCTT